MKNKIKIITYKIYKFLKDIQISLSINKAKCSKFSKKILIVKPDAIGDYILFRNFISEIKKSKKYRGYKIYLLGNTLWKNIFDTFDKKETESSFWINSKGIYYYPFEKLKELKNILDKENFKVIIYPAFSRVSAIDVLISKLNAKEKISFVGDTINTLNFEKKFLDKNYTKLIKTKEEFEFNKNIDFFEQILEKKIKLKTPRIKLTSKERNYIVMNPGASSILKRWDSKNFSKLADFLINKYGFDIYLVGSKSEKRISEKIKNLSSNKKKVRIFNGKELSKVIDLISSSKGVITNETSTAHMAVALNKKVYCISNGNHYGRFYPYKGYKKAKYFYPPMFNPKKDLTKEGLCFLDINRIRFVDIKDKIIFQ